MTVCDFVNDKGWDRGVSAVLHHSTGILALLGSFLMASNRAVGPEALVPNRILHLKHTHTLSFYSIYKSFLDMFLCCFSPRTNLYSTFTRRDLFRVAS